MSVYVTVTSETGFDEYWFEENQMRELTDYLINNAKEY